MPRVETENPCLIVIVADQSYSMENPIGGSSALKKDALASAVNQLLYKIARFKCRKPTGDGSYTIRPRFHFALIGYSDDRVYSAFEGALATRTTVPIDEVASNPVDVVPQVVVEDGIEETSSIPVWLRAKAAGNTPMHSALQHAAQVVDSWLPQWPDLTVPPIVLNITDGHYTSGPDPSPAARALKDICVGDQNVLLFNLHLSEDRSDPVFCPDSPSALTSEWGRLLFDMSSELTPQMRQLARELGYDVADHARGFAFNADFATVFDFLDIGSLPPEEHRHDRPLGLPAGN